MRILLSFEFLGLGGTETYTVTVARELERLGHQTAIYAHAGGEMVPSARAAGLEVLGARQLPPACDLIVAGDAATALDLGEHYREAIVVFVAHSAEYMLQAPPQIADRVDAVVVLNDRVRRAVQARAWHAPVVRLRQPIDRLRFTRLNPPRLHPATVLVSTNYVTGPRSRLIEEACRRAELELSWIGATSVATPTPELALGAADVVMGLGRSVLEGMAAGRAAYVYGVLGGDGWVTPERYPALEANGFAGTADPGVALDVDRLTADLQRWNPSMGEINSDLICAHHGVNEHAIALIELARELRGDRRREVTATAELARLVRLQWRSEGQARSAVREASSLRSQLADRDRELSSLREHHRRMEAELARAQAVLARAQAVHAQAQAVHAQAERAHRQTEAAVIELRATRRYRLACRLAAPLDAVRAARRARHDASSAS